MKCTYFTARYVHVEKDDGSESGESWGGGVAKDLYEPFSNGGSLTLYGTEFHSYLESSGLNVQ